VNTEEINKGRLAAGRESPASCIYKPSHKYMERVGAMTLIFREYSETGILRR